MEFQRSGAATGGVAYRAREVRTPQTQEEADFNARLFEELGPIEGLDVVFEMPTKGTLPICTITRGAPPPQKIIEKLQRGNPKDIDDVKSMSDAQLRKRCADLGIMVETHVTPEKMRGDIIQKIREESAKGPRALPKG